MTWNVITALVCVTLCVSQSSATQIVDADGVDYFSDLSRLSAEQIENLISQLSEREALDLQIEVLLLDERFTAKELEYNIEYLERLVAISHRDYGLPFNALDNDEREQLLDTEEVRTLALELGIADTSPGTEGCGYIGSTAYDPVITQDENFEFDGHVAIYFRVDGQANCYHNTCGKSTWGGDCGDGSIRYWHLLCRESGCPWYWFMGYKWVKDVTLLIPKRWWYAYFFYSNETKASWFRDYWRYDRLGGCCDPGC